MSPPIYPQLRGVHYIQPDGIYAIHYQEGQWGGTNKLTLLHDTYEIIHEQVWHRRYDCQPTSTTTTRLRWWLHPAFTAGGAASLVGAARPLVA